MRRPAAAVVGALPKGKAKARARGIRRPGAAVAPVGRVDSPAEKFLRGETIESIEVPVDRWKKHELLVFDKAIYYGQEVAAAGRFRDLLLHDGKVHLKVILSGTTNEELLKHGTAVNVREATVHCCPEGCGNIPEGPMLLHSRQVRRVSAEDEVSLTWEKNMEATIPDTGLPDEVQALRRKEEELRKAEMVGESKEKKSKKKKKKEKDRDKDKELPNLSDSGSTATAAKKRKYGGRTIAKEGLDQVFSGTGLDAKAKVRRKIIKMVQRRIKRRSRASSSSSSTGSSSSEASAQESDLMGDTSRLRLIARYGPGVLTAAGLASMRQSLADLDGAWIEEGNIHVPLTLRYVRTSMTGKVTGDPHRLGTTGQNRGTHGHVNAETKSHRSSGSRSQLEHQRKVGTVARFGPADQVSWRDGLRQPGAQAGPSSSAQDYDQCRPRKGMERRQQGQDEGQERGLSERWQREEEGQRRWQEERGIGGEEQETRRETRMSPGGEEVAEDKRVCHQGALRDLRSAGEC